MAIRSEPDPDIRPSRCILQFYNYSGTVGGAVLLCRENKLTCTTDEVYGKKEGKKTKISEWELKTKMFKVLFLNKYSSF